MKAISIVIPTYNGHRLLAQHLPAVVAAMKPGDELIISDDASTDDSISWLEHVFNLTKTKHTTTHDLYENSIFSGNRRTTENFLVSLDKKISVKVIANATNQRFAKTVNRGVEQASHELLCLLNNDVEPTQNCFEVLVTSFEHRSQNQPVFGVGCLEHEPQLSGEPVLGGKNKLWFARGLFVHSRAKNFETGETSWISGGSGLFDRDKWQELGGFSTHYYPAYWEDIDLSYRAKQRGWQIWFSAEAIVQHLHESTNSSVFGQKQMEIVSFRHGLVFTWRNGTWWQRLQFLLWLPYHSTVTAYRTKGAFLAGLVLFAKYVLGQETP
jgi:GT2 family glycosyltransferase